MKKHRPLSIQTQLIIETVLAGAVLMFLLLPLLFEIYRINAFDTIPRDPYDAYLLYLAGSDTGFLPGSPFVYRILSVVPGLIPYSLISAPTLSNLKDINPDWLNAVFAMAFVSYFSIVCLSSLMFYAVRSLGADKRMTACFAALLVPVIHQFAAPYITDPFVILYLFFTFLIFKKPIFWTFFLLIGVGVNEKIPLVWAFYTSCVLFYRRDKSALYTFILSVFACLLYCFLRRYYSFEGYENQLDVTTFYDGFMHSLKLSFSFKGILRNFFPIILMGFIALPVFYSKKLKWNFYEVYPIHMLIVLGLAFVSFATDVQFNVGRNVLHVFPIFLPTAVLWLEKMMLTSSAHPASDLNDS